MGRVNAELKARIANAETWPAALHELGQHVINTCMLFGTEASTAFNVAALLVDGIERSWQEPKEREPLSRRGRHKRTKNRGENMQDTTGSENARWMEAARQLVADWQQAGTNNDEPLALLVANAMRIGNRMAHTPEEKAIKPIREVWNAWSVDAYDFDGTQLEQPQAQLGRPQDWGHPRYTLVETTFIWELPDCTWINHCNIWTDMKLPQPADYVEVLAGLIVQVLYPGAPPHYAGTAYLGPDDAWDDEWGYMPPIVDESAAHE